MVLLEAIVEVNGETVEFLDYDVAYRYYDALTNDHGIAAKITDLRDP